MFKHPKQNVLPIIVINAIDSNTAILTIKVQFPSNFIALDY